MELRQADENVRVLRPHPAQQFKLPRHVGAAPHSGKRPHRTRCTHGGKPVGGADYHPSCSIPGTQASTDPASADNINVKVPAQLVARQTDKAVYCSCRCDGPDKNARYCECPEGFQCEPLVANLKITTGSQQLAGSYCIRAGSKYNPNDPRQLPSGDTCADNASDCGCGGSNPPAECGAK